jgi:group I intron endonuclease
MLNFDCGIYTITSPSGRQYVGSAQSLRKRWTEHLRDLRKGRHHCEPLQRAFNKYGEMAMQFGKVAIVPRAELLTREQEQINERAGNLYNTARDALAPMKGRKHKPSTRSVMSEIAKARMTPEARAHLSEIRKARGLKPTADSVAKGVAARIGRPLSSEFRAKLSAALTGRKRSAAAGAAISAGKANRMTVANTSGVVGASLHASGKWKACAHIAGRSRYLGLFNTLEEAAAAIATARSDK